jgi:hypothetical protein
MTILVSAFGVLGRFAGDLLTSALSWASSLLFGRVPRSHQTFLILMMAGSFAWLLVGLALLLPGIGSWLLDSTPHPPFVDRTWLQVALIVAFVALPPAVGLAGFLVPAEGERPRGLAAAGEVLRGYLLVPVIAGLLIFLAGVGVSRKIRSARHGWAEVHVPIVVKPHGYDQLIGDLHAAVASADLPTTARDAPWVLTLPAAILTRVAGSHVRKLRPDRLVELTGPNLRIGVYPSDIAISGTAHDRVRARAAILSRLATTSAHLTTSAEAQAFEDRIEKVAEDGRTGGVVAMEGAQEAFAALDAQLLDLPVQSDEWDILYRLRLQVERDLLAGSEPGRSFPGDAVDAPRSAAATHRHRSSVPVVVPHGGRPQGKGAVS